MTNQLTMTKLPVQRNFVTFSNIHFYFLATEDGLINTSQDHLAIRISVDN